MPTQNGSRGSRRPRRRLGRRVRPNESDAQARGYPGKGSADDEHEQRPDHTYKTEMCNNWIEFGQCRYNNKCRFAHGEEELRVARRINSDKNWKSELCRNYHNDGTCSYGRRCHFIHEETPQELARMHATGKRLSVQKTKRRAKPRVENTAISVKQHTWGSASTAAATRAQEEQEEQFPVGSLSSATSAPAAATPAPASSVASVPLENLPIHPHPHEEAVMTTPSSSLAAPFLSSPMPISRKQSLQRFCRLVGLPVEEINPNEAAAEEAVASGSPPSSESPPFLLRPQSAFGHMHGKVMYDLKIPFTPAVVPRTPPRMDNDSPTKRRVRLPVFTRIASDTGVSLTHPPSPVTTSP